MRSKFLKGYLLFGVCLLDAMEDSSLKQWQHAEDVIVYCKTSERFRFIGDANYVRNSMPKHVRKSFLKKYFLPCYLQKPEKVAARLVELTHQGTLAAESQLANLLIGGVDPAICSRQKINLIKQVPDHARNSFAREIISHAENYKERERIQQALVYVHTLAEESPSSYFQLLPPDFRRFFLKNYCVATYQKNQEAALTHMKELLDARDFTTVQALLEYGVEVHKNPSCSGGLLHHAAIFPCSRATKLLLSYNANAATNGNDQVHILTPLEIALQKGNSSTVACLLKHGILVESPAYCFQLAIEAHSLACIRLLLQHGLNANASENNNFTPLLSCLFYDELPGARLLLEHGADPHTTGAIFCFGKTLLHFAANRQAKPGEKPEEMVNLLLEFGADPYRRDDDGKLPIEEATTPEIKKVIADAMGKKLF